MRQQIADLEIQHEKEVSALSEEVSHLKKKVALYEESTQKHGKLKYVKPSAFWTKPAMRWLQL